MEFFKRWPTSQDRPKVRRTRRSFRIARFESLEDRALFAVGELRIVSYNVHAIGDSFGRGSGLPSSSLGTVLQAIGNETTNGLARPLDLVALQEVRSQATTSADVVSQLNAIYGAGTYARGSLNGNPTSDTVGLVYNSQTLQLLNETAIGTASSSGQPRQAIRYQLRPIGGNAASDFYVYNSHYKAGDTSEDEDRRNIEATAIRADADALGSANIIYVGDFNIQSSSESPFQTLVSAGNGQAFDPINRLGTWNNNNSFKDILTQAPLNTPPSGFTGGGLDDRFDFQLVTGELTDGAGLEYLANSYHTFGNNGSLSVNSNINDAGNTALPGLANRTTILNLLTTVSDHLPVVADFHAAAAVTTTVQFATASQNVSEGVTSFTVTVQLSAAAAQNVTVPFTLSGTALSGVDYTLTTPSPRTITAGSTSTAISFTVSNDLLDEPDETVILTLGTPTNAALGTTTVHTATLTDNDPAPTIQWTSSVQNVSEGTSSLTLTAQLSAVSGQNVTVPSTLGGSATAGGVDYSAVTASPLTIPAGSLSGTVTLNLVNDLLDEANETIAVTLGTPTNATLGATTNHTVTILDNDLLQVTSLTPTATGFQVNFNGPVNAAAVNLYDQDNIYGAADVTLSGATSGSVRGSLILNSAADQLTFVRTGGYDLPTNSFGTLAPDNYSLTLRSGASGFVGVSGDQLDGNANGVSGDDYSTIFSVAPPPSSAVVLSVPDFARGFGQDVNVPANSTSGIPLTISRGAGLSSVSFTLQYDPALLTISGATKGPGVLADVVLSVNTSTPGQAVISLTSPSQLSYFNAPFTLVNLTATVPITASYTEKHRLAITGGTVTAGATSLPVLADDGVHVATFFGDLDASRTYNSADLPALQRVVTGANSGFGADRNADPVILADLSGNGGLQSDDVDFVYRLIQSVAVPNVPPLPGGIVSPPPTGVDPRIFVSRDLMARSGRIVSVPIELTATASEPITLSAVDLSLSYDPAVLSVLGLRSGSLLGSQTLAYGPARLGELELHAWSGQGTTSLRSGQTGSLVIVDFLISASAAGEVRVNLTPGSRVPTAVYDGELTSLVLDPIPTWDSNDEIDGLITILAGDSELLQAQRNRRAVGPTPLKS